MASQGGEEGSGQARRLWHMADSAHLLPSSHTYMHTWTRPTSPQVYQFVYQFRVYAYMCIHIRYDLALYIYIYIYIYYVWQTLFFRMDSNADGKV